MENRTSLHAASTPTTIGILIHVNNVEAPDWEYVAWGDPSENKLGSLPTLCLLLLNPLLGSSITQVVIHSGPSQKDGLKEGAYTKQFLLDNLESLAEFPRLRQLLDTTGETVDMLRERTENIIIGTDLVRTSDEIAATAKLFQFPKIQQVIQIACAGHAPRCMQLQADARSNGLIPYDQLWSVMASDVFFSKTESAKDIVIFEKPHLAYDPMITFAPTAPEVLNRYFTLSAQAKQEFLTEAQQFMDKHRD
ncbi:MAG TPA: hypothetical protein VLG92_02725 [Candidatus Saccharimonadia bacterium]|nr:hypothetical protein [Candidatus Saccharimonadia bacterium]